MSATPPDINLDYPDPAPPADLADRAARRARTVRGRRRAGAVAMGVTAIALTVAGLGALGGAASTPAPASTGTPTPLVETDARAAGSCVTLDSHRQPRWSGQASPALTRIGDRLSQLGGEHPDAIAGVAYCSDYSGVEIYVSATTGPAVEAVRNLAAQHPGIVRILQVPRSLTQLLDAMQTVGGLRSSGVVGVAPDLLSGGLQVTLEARTPEEISAISAQRGADVARAKAAISAAVGADVPVWFEPGGEGTDLLGAAH